MSAIPAMMKAAVVEKHGEPLVIKQVPVPQPGHGQVLVKIITSGVCHTDLHVRDGDWVVKSSVPVIPGHEGAGIVVKVGSGVESLKVGDRVGSAWLHDACGSCEHCLQGWETVCGKQHQTGFFSDGCFAEYTVCNAEYVGRIPDGLSFAETSPILCAGVTTYKGLKETEVKPGQWVAIVGASGGLGHIAIQYAKAMGMRVLSIDAGQEKLDYCHSLGSDAEVDAKSATIVDDVRAKTSGGPHGVLVVAPVNKCFEDGSKYLRSRGTMVGISLPPGGFNIDILDWILNRKTIRGSIVGTRMDLAESLEIAALGKVKSKIQERPFEHVNDILDELKTGKVNGRVVLRVAAE